MAALWFGYMVIGLAGILLAARFVVRGLVVAACLYHGHDMTTWYKYPDGKTMRYCLHCKRSEAIRARSE